MAKQQRDLDTLLENQNTMIHGSIQEALSHFAGKLRHDDLVPMEHLACQQPWMIYYYATLMCQEQIMYGTQQLHFALGQNLAEVLEAHLNQLQQHKDKKIIL